jgi:hypothetical protein
VRRRIGKGKQKSVPGRIRASGFSELLKEPQRDDLTTNRQGLHNYLLYFVCYMPSFELAILSLNNIISLEHIHYSKSGCVTSPTHKTTKHGSPSYQKSSLRQLDRNGPCSAIGFGTMGWVDHESLLEGRSHTENILIDRNRCILREDRRGRSLQGYDLLRC